MCFVEKVVLMGKMAMFRGFFRHVAQKNEPFSVGVIKTLLRHESHTSYFVSAFEVLFFLTHCPVCSVSGGQRALKSSKVESRFHFTRQIEQNDEYLCKCFSSWKFLWMSLFQFSEMYTSSHIFHFYLLESSSSHFGYITFCSHLVPFGWGIARKSSAPARPPTHSFFF